MIKKNDINVKDNKGFTALQHAVILGDAYTVALLLSKNATKNDFNKIDPSGLTSLHYPTHRENKSMIQYLLTKGANPKIKSKQLPKNYDDEEDDEDESTPFYPGKSALEVAEILGLKRTLRLYGSYGYNLNN